jgi:exodeoxyribonuclease VII small subunit
MTRKSDKPASFEAAMTELEALISRMEEGQLPLADALGAYRRGAELLQFCQGALADAQQQVRILEGEILKPYVAATEPE